MLNNTIVAPTEVSPIQMIASSMIEKKDEINKELGIIKNDMAEMHIGAADPADIATNNELFVAKRDRLNNLLNQLQGIEIALQQVDDGEFGLCTMCNEEISIKRLQALVFSPSPLCVNCKDAVERRNGGHHAY